MYIAYMQDISRNIIIICTYKRVYLILAVTILEHSRTKV